MADYAASKAGVVRYTMGVARDLGSRGITANVVEAGLMDTGMAPDPEPLKGLVSSLSLQRMGRTEEVAAAIWFLASPAASYAGKLQLPRTAPAHSGCAPGRSATRPGQATLQGEGLGAWVQAQRLGWDQLLPAQAWMLENQTGLDEAFSAKTDKATWYVSKARAAPA
jgi:hypothetical protein